MTIKEYTKALCDLPGGREAQIRHAIQEMAELTVELTKELDGEGDIEKIREELTDSILMVHQLRIIFGLSKEDWGKRASIKANRTLKEKGLSLE